MAHHNPDHADHVGHAPAHHQAPIGMYFLVFFGLMALTILTVAVSRVNLHAWNTPIALGIAIAKATLVILWFMHVLHSPRMTWVVLICSVLWLGVLFVLTFSDYLTRALSLY